MNSLAQICWLLMAQVSPPGAAAPATEAAKAASETSQPGLFDGLTIFLPAMLIIMFLYMMLMGRSQSKENRNASELLANLKKTDRVVTAGGIIGTVVNLRQDVDHVTLRIDDSSGTKMQVLKQSIVRVINEEK